MLLFTEWIARFGCQGLLWIAKFECPGFLWIVKNDRIKSNLNVSIKGIIENVTTFVDSKTDLNPNPTPKPAHQGLKKMKITNMSA